MKGEKGFEYKGTKYTIEQISDKLYTVLVNGKVVGIAGKEIVSSSTTNDKFTFDFTYAALLANAKGEKSFSADGKYLIFNATQDLNPIYSQVEWNYAYTNMGALYIALLQKDGVSPFLPADGEKAAAEKPAEAKSAEEAPAAEAPAEAKPAT